MVVAGWNANIDVTLDNVQVINLASEIQSCLTPSDYPLSVWGPVGTMFNGSPLVCGGFDDVNDNSLNECYQYNYQDNIWAPTNQNMLESRVAPAASMVDSATLFISGGGFGSSLDNSLDSTEVYHNGTFSYGPNLPSARYIHCQVTLNTSHIAILGGYNGTDLFYDFHLLDWDSHSWIEMPEMPIDMFIDPCGLIKNSVNGQELVVLGDYENCRIFNFREHEWKVGPNLPEDTKIDYASMVAQMETSFYLLGGLLKDRTRTDAVFRFDEENYEWIRQSFSLSTPTDAGVAFPVPDQLLTVRDGRIYCNEKLNHCNSTQGEKQFYS